MKAVVCSVLMVVGLIAANQGALLLAQEQPAHKIQYNIVLITPDQMRADSMHAYGYPLQDTPNIDQLADHGVTFLRAYSAGAWTTPSFTSIFTGLFPIVHGMTLPPYQAGCGAMITRPVESAGLAPADLLLSPDKPVIPDILKKHGMITAADVANCWAIWDMWNRSWDYRQMIYTKLPRSDNWFASSLYLTAPQTTSWAEQWLSKHGTHPFFLWVHYMEPHSPYNAPESYDRFKTPDDYPNMKDSVELHAMAKVGNQHAIRRLKQLYAAKILYVDHYIGELLKYIDKQGLDKNTIVILMSDHGQLLYSHPQDFNTDDHRSLYDTNLHVPLIIRGPGLPAGVRTKAIVSDYDILPTILDLEGIAVPSWTDGKSLKPVLVQGAQQVHQYVYAEETVLTPQVSVRNTRYKLIESLRSGKIQCFDDAHDPSETHSDCKQIPVEASVLKSVLDRHIQSAIQKAKSYSDWKNNQTVAVVEQRDSAVLKAVAPKSLVLSPAAPDGAHFQLTGRLWSHGKDKSGLAFWAPPGATTAIAMWRSDTPLIGEYEVSVRYGDVSGLNQTLARNANYVVHFKGGSLGFSVNQNERQDQWVPLGRFHDPVSVVLTNLADGPVVAESTRFIKVGENQNK